ncbi:hypothetical protein V5O48_007857 [Marasmius crinis-equi]|uniref:Uncharacterized protein n=1 Tax=Marasmius crinis-equi TaxID=585013 RepID=A0ABR3FFN1_9AGAR
MPVRKPYSGLVRKLVIAFDIGTTYSGASYAVLDPGLPPIIEGVTKFPAQGKAGGDSKIPSVIYYDRNGQVQAIGAEAIQDSFIEKAEEEEYTAVEWFKLHLRPKGLEKSQIQDSHIPPLPPKKRAIDVYADFLRYLHQCTITFIKQGRGADFFLSVEHNIDYILTHPNGWEGVQQGLMRQAAIRAGLVSAVDAHSRLQFVTEGEASLHYCISKGVLRDTDMVLDKGFIIVDAGGGTIDLSAYKRTPSGVFQEIARTQCRLQGSIYVTRWATEWLMERLKNSKYNTPQDITRMAKEFDKVAKLVFRDETEMGYIQFGSLRDKDLSVGITRGVLKIPGENMKSFFTHSVREILGAIDEQVKEADTPISAVYLVGGFAASDYLFSTLEKDLEKRKLSSSRPDGFVNKAVTDGAISFYLDRMVSARVARFTYGLECSTAFNPHDPDHKERSHTVFTSAAGDQRLAGKFDVILYRGTRVSEETEFRRSYEQVAATADSLRNLSVELLHYKGHDDAPIWIDIEPKRFPALCTIEADTPNNLIDTGYDMRKGRSYHRCKFDVVLLLGLTELKAQISWKVNGVENRSPATVVYDRSETHHS